MKTLQIENKVICFNFHQRQRELTRSNPKASVGSSREEVGLGAGSKSGGFLFGFIGGNEIIGRAKLKVSSPIPMIEQEKIRSAAWYKHEVFCSEPSEAIRSSDWTAGSKTRWRFLI